MLAVNLNEVSPQTSFLLVSFQVSATCCCQRTSIQRVLPLTQTTSTSRRTTSALLVWCPWLILPVLLYLTLWANADLLVSRCGFCNKKKVYKKNFIYRAFFKTEDKVLSKYDERKGKNRCEHVLEANSGNNKALIKSWRAVWSNCFKKGL